MAASDLCTLTDVRELLQKKATDKGQDGLIEKLITRASVAAMGFCQRQFAPVEAGVSHEFDWPWEGELVSFAPWDLQSVTNPETSVQADTDQTQPYALSIDEYRLWPYNKRDGVYQSIRVRPFGASVGRIVWKSRKLKVTGTWGFPAIPEDVVHAVAATVVHFLTVNTAAFRRPQDDPNLNVIPRRGLPPEAYDLLKRYKRADSL